jgi:uncharacterized protein (TIGR00730 family)
MGALPVYEQAAYELGTLLAENAYDIVWGGGDKGLMGTVPLAAIKAGARRLHSINLEIWSTGDLGALFDGAVSVVDDDTIMHVVEGDILDRKKTMLRLSQAGIILPGGIGTLDEKFELLVGNDVIHFTNHALGTHTPKRPVIILNTNNFYEGSLIQIERSIRDGFTPRERMDMVRVVDTPQDVIAALDEFNHLAFRDHQRIQPQTASFSLAMAK